MSWASLVVKNLLRRPARTALTAAGVGLGVGLIVALLSITAGVHRTTEDLIHVGRADFGLFQGGVSDFAASRLPGRLAATIARDADIAGTARIKLFVTGDRLVFGLDPAEFAYRRLVVVAGRPGTALAGDRSGLRPGQSLKLGSRTFTVAGLYHSGNRFEDAGVVLPLPVAQAVARTPGGVTAIGVAVAPGRNPKLVARRLERAFPGLTAIAEPGQAVKVDTSSRLIISTGWIISALALIVGGIGVTNTMAMSVFERVHEIGILRAVGWRGRRIAALVVSEALMLCLCALGVGLALGVLAAHQFVEHSTLAGLITPRFTAATFAWGLAFALGVGLVGAAYPTLRAVRLTPIEALRRQ